MQVDLKAALPDLLPKAISWAEAEATRGAGAGRELTGRERDFARKVGVTHPERIRVMTVDALPMPTDPPLRAAAEQTGFLDPRMVGLTLGHSVFICRGHETPRLLSHEFRHVYQYEQAGSIAGFLPGYLLQIVESGYAATTFETDARAHERTDL
jgi:hypothetical protein